MADARVERLRARYDAAGRLAVTVEGDGGTADAVLPDADTKQVYGSLLHWTTVRASGGGRGRSRGRPARDAPRPRVRVCSPRWP